MSNSGKTLKVEEINLVYGGGEYWGDVHQGVNNLLEFGIEMASIVGAAYVFGFVVKACSN